MTQSVTLAAAETLHQISRSFYASCQLVVILYLSYEGRKAEVLWFKTFVVLLAAAVSELSVCPVYHAVAIAPPQCQWHN